MNIRTQHYKCCEAGMGTKITFIPAIIIPRAPLHLRRCGTWKTKIPPYTCAHYPIGSDAFAMPRNRCFAFP